MTNYRCVVTLKNGAHRILRMTRDVVAHVVYHFRKMQQSIFSDRVVLTVNGQPFTLNDVKRMLFINEYTGERLEIA